MHETGNKSKTAKILGSLRLLSAIGIVGGFAIPKKILPLLRLAADANGQLLAIKPVIEALFWGSSKISDSRRRSDRH